MTFNQAASNNYAEENKNHQFNGFSSVGFGTATTDALADETQELAEKANEEKIGVETGAEPVQDMYDGPAKAMDTYLNTELEYKDDVLVTKTGSDGVMMHWEDELLNAGSEAPFKSTEDPNDVNIPNIGFAMGIIGTMIQVNNTTRNDE